MKPSSTSIARPRRDPQMTEQAAPRDARGWAKRAASLRSAQQMEESDAAIAKARQLAPTDPLIAFLQAQSQYELGYPAAALFANARQLWPANPDVVRNHALALASEGNYPAAECLLSDVLAANPEWIEGHRILCGLRWTNGDTEGFDRSYAEACAHQPKNTALWLGWFSAVAQHRNWVRAGIVLNQAEAALDAGDRLRAARAFVACELGDDVVAERLLGELHADRDDFINICRIRFLIRKRDWQQAETIALAMTQSAAAGQVWPYLSVIWRMTGNDRAEWLDGDPLYASVIDVGLTSEQIDELAQQLRALHTAQRPYPEQSVRNGTQTDRSVLLRHEPIFQKARAQLMAAVREFVSQLPPEDAAHPLLGRPREHLQISGSWSVRLTAGGFNVPHTHPHGWISSAFYIALPDSSDNDPPFAGFLNLGSPPADLGLDMQPYHRIKPEVGKLALFPSTMWHSTEPVPAGERLNIAFDIAATGLKTPLNPP